MDECHDREAIPCFSQMRDRPVEDDAAAPARGANGISLETLAIGLVAHEDFLVWRDAGFFEKLLIDGHTALVIHIRIRNDGAVDFRTENDFQHGEHSKATVGKINPDSKFRGLTRSSALFFLRVLSALCS